MKSKKRHQSSSDDESDDSETSKMSNSSSGSDSDDSSTSEQRYKKKRKRADSSESETDSNDQKRSKKRKHKKKKKKHGKKKRQTETVEVSDSGEELSSVSEGEISPKKKRKHKHKHKHSKRARTSSASVQEEFQLESRLHSVVKERRATSEESQPSRTYYQKEYRRSGSGEDEYEREREVQRFYRGSSKERRNQYVEHYQYERGNNDRYAAARQEKYERNKYAQSAPITHTNEEYTRRPREYIDYKRPQRYEERRYPEEEYHRKPREESYHVREDPRGNNRYNQYEDRAPKRREFDVGVRDYPERRSGPPDGDRYRDRDKKEKYREEMLSTERDREDLRERTHRPDRPPVPIPRERPKSKSPEDRYRDKNRREDRGDERGEERYGREEKRENRDERRDPRGERRDPRDDRRPRPARSESYKEERDSRVVVKTEPGTRERKSRFEADDKEYAWGKDVKKEGDKEGDKEKPNFGLSGKLTADVNTVNGVVIKYTEPDDAKQPKRRWRFYPFKGDKALPILYIHRQSSFIIGRDKKVVDIILEHPSISKQHAALQYRATPFTRTDGSQGRRVRPYVIDLESANGTFVNNKKIDPRRYVELLERDVVKFGFSQREYVLLHENSKDDAMDDDNNDPPAVGGNVTTTQQLKQEKRIKEETAADGD